MNTKLQRIPKNKRNILENKEVRNINIYISIIEKNILE